MREISYICYQLESMYIDDCGLKLKQLTISRKIGRLHCIFYSSPLTVETSDLTFITSVRYVQLLNKTENRKRKNGSEKCSGLGIIDMMFTEEI